MRFYLTFELEKSSLPKDYRRIILSYIKKSLTEILDGKTKVKSKTFSSVKPDASAQNVYEVAEALMELQEYSTIEVAKIDNTTLA